MKRARSSLSGGSSACTAASRACGGLPAAGRQRLGGLHIGLVGVLAAPSPGRRASPRRHRWPPHPPRSAGAGPRARRRARRICGRRREARRGAPRSAPARADRIRWRGSPLAEPARASSMATSAASRALTLGSTRAGAWAPRRSSLRTAAESTGTGEALPATASKASLRSCATFSDCIMTTRRSASVSSSPACGVSFVSSSTAWRRKSASLRAFSMRLR